METEHPRDERGTHRTHCCIRHGCKYGDEDCPVADGTVWQEYACEYCISFDPNATGPLPLKRTPYTEKASPEERVFLAQYDAKDYPIITTTVDVVALDHAGGETRVLLVKRKNFPYKDRWALPGGFVDQNEDTATAAAREIEEEAGLRVGNLSFLCVADKPDRDPRGRTISLVYKANSAQGDPYAGDDAVEAAWFELSDALYLPLAFDHNEILKRVL